MKTKCCWVKSDTLDQKGESFAFFFLWLSTSPPTSSPKINKISSLFCLQLSQKTLLVV
uniref:Uncharacterized protein n=1 Tax=Solanum lycopersicum TaxID=4081 RepID=A0A3Q7IWT9_SOLLC